MKFDLKQNILSNQLYFGIAFLLVGVLFLIFMFIFTHISNLFLFLITLYPILLSIFLGILFILADYKKADINKKKILKIAAVLFVALLIVWGLESLVFFLFTAF
ncbi:MAG: hypothetical protein GF317_20430 [Candidatus Lokiarchaeota archaeon]|nr:hypothetical protein [Candidatus Lokiarchaeota archaeon]MBD3201853.1 hypothetical protein [Candidatus Lokiarchaeota archaeon]